MNTDIYCTWKVKLKVDGFSDHCNPNERISGTHPPTEILTVLGLYNPSEILDHPLKTIISNLVRYLLPNIKEMI